MNIELIPAPKSAWFTPAESREYYKKYSRDGITVHWWGGGEQEDKHDSIVNYFLRQGELGIKSVNYVCSDAKITQMVHPDNVAWCSNSGNPTTISIEFEPRLSDEGYRKGAWLIAMLESKYGKKLKLYRHSDWNPTSCPGTIDVDRLRREADALSNITPIVHNTQTPATPVPVPSTKQTVYLPSTVASWAVYKVGSSYRKGTADQVGSLLPQKFGGLTYEIKGRDANTVQIDTRDFGRVAIWVTGTSAVIRGADNYVPAPAPAKTQAVTFPASIESWAVYKVGSGYRKGTSDQVGTLLPKKFGGLTYPIIQNLGNVVVIDTQNFGRVAAWVKDTVAQIK